MIASSSSASTAELDGLASPKQWTEAELIDLAEHMQQEVDVRDRWAFCALLCLAMPCCACLAGMVSLFW